MYGKLKKSQHRSECRVNDSKIIQSENFKPKNVELISRARTKLIFQLIELSSIELNLLDNSSLPQLT